MTRRPKTTTAVLAVVGMVGSLLVTLTSYTVGALPGHHLTSADATGPERWLFAAGIALLIAAWLALGRLVLDSSVTGMARRVSWAAAAMFAPLLASAPLGSQDVWAYLGQGNVAAHGLNPYTVGPVAAPGPFLDAVAHDWVRTPSQYGPLWTWICKLVVLATDPDPWVGMFALRILGVAAIVVSGVAITRLCVVTRARPEVALWLSVAGPFTALMLIGAVHNDSVMLAFLLCGLWVTTAGRTLWRGVLLGAFLVGVAAAVKVAALVVLPFLPLLWLRHAAASLKDQAPTQVRSQWLVPGAVATVVGVTTLLTLGVVTGYGFGWATQVAGGVVGIDWLSLPQLVASVAGHVDPGLLDSRGRPPVGLLRGLSALFLVPLLAALTLTARRRPPLRTMALATLLLLVCVPAPRVWYLVWPIVILAADLVAASVVVPVITLSASVSLWFPPAVHPSTPSYVLPGLLASLAVVSIALLRASGYLPGQAEAQGLQQSNATPRHE